MALSLVFKTNRLTTLKKKFLKVYIYYYYVRGKIDRIIIREIQNM